METLIPAYNQIRTMVGRFSQHLKLQRYASKKGRPLAVGIEDAIALAIFKQTYNIATKRAVFKLLGLKKKYTYKTMVVNINKRSPLALAMLFIVMRINRQNAHTIKHIDSTDLPVCLFKNAHGHKTTKGLARFGKSAKGTYFGFKMHLISDIQRKFLAVHFTGANANDRDVVIPMSRDLTGLFIADGGYVSAKLEKDFYREGKRAILIAPRKNMKKLMTKFQELLYRTRMTIEFDFRNLKLFYGLVTSMPRSVNGYFAHYIYSLLAYCIA